MRSILDNTRRSDVTFYKDGRIDITAHVATDLRLQEGDVIDIAYDDEGEYFLYIKKKGTSLLGRHEAQCRATNRRGKVCHNFRAYSRRLCREVLRLNGNKDRARLIAGTLVENELGKALPIIIRYRHE
jgi:hypothetical protein